MDSEDTENFWTAMSVRATRPRSRRGRHAPPVSVPSPCHTQVLGPCGALSGSEFGSWGHLQGELDPVAEEAEAASVNSELGSQPSQESCKPELLGPKVEASVQGLGSR